MILVYPLVDELSGSYDILEILAHNTPKAFFAHSYCDKTVSVSQSLKLMQKLWENGGEFESLIYRSKDYGFLLLQSL